MSTKPYEVSPDDRGHFRRALEIATESDAPKAVVDWLQNVVVETGNSRIVDQHFATVLAKQGHVVPPHKIREIREHLRELGVSVKLCVDPTIPPVRDVPAIPNKPFGELS